MDLYICLLYWKWIWRHS